MAVYEVIQWNTKCTVSKEVYGIKRSVRYQKKCTVSETEYKRNFK